MKTFNGYKTMHALSPKIPLTFPCRRSANTIYSNTANGTNSASGIEDSSPTAFYNNILYDNSDPQLDNSPGIEYSFIDTTTAPSPLNNNIGPFSSPAINDPKFAGTNPANLETFLHLASDSPCLEKGDPEKDSVRYRDFDSQLGPLDGPEDPENNNPEREMGADEYPTPDPSVFSYWWENF